MDQRTTRTNHQQDGLDSLRLQVPGLTILSHPDSKRVGDQATLPQLGSGQSVSLSRLEPLFVAPGGDEKFRPLDDPYLSRSPMQLSPGPKVEEVSLDCRQSRISVFYKGKKIEGQRAFAVTEIDHGVVLNLNHRITLLLHKIDPVPITVPGFGLVGESGGALRLRQDIRSAGALEVPVLLRGETGTGKELVARALHEASSRSEGPYITVNMGAIAPSLAAAELFGAVRGAYTGADRKKAGFFQAAKGGTLFLDEIGEAPAEVQVMLLRALENHEIQPVGSVDPVAIDVRVVAATDALLESAIAEGRFRAPLLHRLAGFEIRLPPLRERRDDISRLFFHFLQEEAQTLSHRWQENTDTPWPPAVTVVRLVEYDWPGNVRQLRNVVRRMLIAHRDGFGDREFSRLVERITAESLSTPLPATPLPATPSRSVTSLSTPSEPPLKSP